MRAAFRSNGVLSYLECFLPIIDVLYNIWKGDNHAFGPSRSDASNDGIL